MNYLYTCTFKS